MTDKMVVVDEAIAHQHWIDRAADPIQRVVEPLVHRNQTVANVLHGEWLGHPLHAAMTDIPVGAWTTGFVFDMAELFGGTRRLRRAADGAIVVGLVGAMGAAVAGMADWSRTRGEAKRVGFVHAGMNSVVALLYGVSIFARRSRKRNLGIALSSLGFGLTLFSAWLGGELSYRHGVGLKDEAFRQGRQNKTTDEDVDYLADLSFMRTAP